ncbi:DUF3021 domain-containing protein [Tetragenococcus osmophilus]|uniref:DUF3021 domain-containing protein n=1 Tax=Tetragenococcus osmophilus TaxID=526944 RepID=A0AA37XIE2_9ENTE|nr:DUF3021 domain-containing protein [Tetragenococcus osmophilus]AYW47084.1 DUF3021 domain-containing protein [Tetragenococcus osmophilus]GMA55155.1 DUF3021 domain-containing protein [Alicyclobacillus contaminans]GMA71072.1 DUF3021 domain-containing protein [Tetragenococcus osmophilus]
MLKKVAFRLLAGVIVGTFIGLALSIGYSFYYGEEIYQPATPEFVNYFSNELYAFLAAITLWSAMGSIFSLGSLLFSDTDWSILKMTLTHFIITYLTFLPLAVLAGWTTLDLGILLEFTLTFFMIYVVIWFTTMLKVKKEIQTLNDHLKQNK